MSLEELAPVLKAVVRELRESDRLPVMLTYRMAAHELSCGLTKLHVLIRQGKIRTRMVGGQPMVPASEVLKFAKLEDRPPRQKKGAPYSLEAELAKVDAHLRKKRRRC